MEHWQEMRKHEKLPQSKKINEPINPLSANPTKWSNTLKTFRQLATADELFECV